jgi:DNA-3-methyladenine glycosylase
VSERRLERHFFGRDSLVVAPELLGKILVAGECAGRIVEVEAYRADDPASHAYRGRTARNAVMFGPPGFLYVYFTYGMHHCANVVTGDEGDGQAVLLRAVAPIRGIDLMSARRGGRAALADGPAKLCQAFGIDRRHDGSDLCADGAVTIVDDGTPPPVDAVTTPRIGITRAIDQPWRWVSSDPSPSQDQCSQ